MPIHFEHRRSSRTEAISTGVATFACGVAAMVICWNGVMYRWSDLLLIPIPAFMGYCFWLVTIGHRRANRGFVFRIDASMIEQTTPAPIFGKSFAIPLLRVRHVLYVRQKQFDDMRRDLFIVDQDGQQFEVTPGYLNPLDRIVATLKALNIPVLMEAPADQTPMPPTATKTS